MSLANGLDVIYVHNKKLNVTLIIFHDLNFSN